jgi:enterobactin synthetase component D
MWLARRHDRREAARPVWEASLPNQTVLPPFVARPTVRFEFDDSTAWGVQFPGVPLPASLGNAARKRQAEFLAGRHCVREALHVLRHPSADLAVPSGPHDEPIWPAGIVGSITHTRRFASAAVARRAHARAIGIDLEDIVSEQCAQQLEGRVAGRSEIASLVAATGWTFATAFTLVFSAKEAIFKCLYPEVRHYFDFHVAWVSGVDPERGSFSAQLLQTLTPSLVSGYAIQGMFACDGTAVFSAVVLPA